MTQANQIQNFGLTKNAIMASLKNQQTTIILQKILMEAKAETIALIINELKGEYRNIMNDRNGFMICTDLFEICVEKERISILEELYPTLIDDCVKKFASRPIQILIKNSSCELEYKLILFSFHDHNKLLFASMDPSGSYAIQNIIEYIPEKFRVEFNHLFTSFISFLSKQQYGVYCVKKFISFTKDENIIKKILNFIKDNFMSLAIDKFGNYLIQHLLQKWMDIPEGKIIKDLVIQNFKSMMEKQYSSYICELFIQMLSDDEKTSLINSLNLNEIKKMNNSYSIKIMNCLGINIEHDNDINDDFEIQIPIFFYISNAFMTNRNK